MPAAGATIVEERLQSLIDKKQLTLQELEKEAKQIRREIEELQFCLDASPEAATRKIRVLRGDKKERAGVALDAKQRKSGSGKNFKADWSAEEDNKILAIVRAKGKSGSGEIANEVEKKLKDRSIGAIRQRIYKLAEAGKLKKHEQRIGKKTQMMLEVA